MPARAAQLLERLADGGFRSGEVLAAELGISRAAVWKLVRGWQARGLDIQAVRGRGYRLARPLELLDAGLIQARLDETAAARLGPLEVLAETDSTNTRLAQLARSGLPAGAVCLAESQRAGRGRLGRQWISPYAANLYLSVLWRFALPPAALAGLSLAIGVALARSLERFGVGGHGLKWPNDLLWDARKLGGVLLEFGGESEGCSHVIIGVGVNVAMPESAGGTIDQSWIDLATVLGRTHVSRNRLAALLLSEIAIACTAFGESGLDSFQSDWQRWDAVAGRPVRLLWPGHVVEGIARGIAADGELQLDTASGRRSFAIGELSLRPA